MKCRRRFTRGSRFAEATRPKGGKSDLVGNGVSPPYRFYHFILAGGGELIGDLVGNGVSPPYRILIILYWRGGGNWFMIWSATVYPPRMREAPFVGVKSLY